MDAFAAQDAATARVLDRLSAGPIGAKVSAEERLQRLDEATLARLTDLLSQRAPKGQAESQPSGLARVDPQSLRSAPKKVIHRWKPSR